MKPWIKRLCELKSRFEGLIPTVIVVRYEWKQRRESLLREMANSFKEERKLNWKVIADMKADLEIIEGNTSSKSILQTFGSDLLTVGKSLRENLRMAKKEQENLRWKIIYLKYVKKYSSFPVSV